MILKRPFTIVMGLVLLLGLGCSGSSNSPVSPDSQMTGLTDARSANTEPVSGKALWGYWMVIIDTQTWEATIVPLRAAEYTCDVVRFLQPPLGQLSNLKITVTDMSEYLTQGLIDVDVSLTHPFPGMVQFTGFDVYGVFVTPGSVFGNYDSDVIYSNGVDDPILLNPDGYTRWQNPVEFNQGANIFNFEPGALGNMNIALFNATINAYKYFADGLAKNQAVEDYYNNPNNVEDRGMFKPGSVNVREYELKFAMIAGVPSLIFQYAVIASWIPADPALSGDPGVIDLPDDFGLDANAHESFYVAVGDNSTLWKEGSASGGSIKLDLEVFDWGPHFGLTSVPDEIYQIIVEGNASVIPGGFAILDQSTLHATAMPGSTAISSVFQVEISGCTPVSNDPFPVLITVESMWPETFDRGNEFTASDERLAAYFGYNLPVDDKEPMDFGVISPNGGETLYMALYHEITWNPDFPGVTDVKIEWSTDNFVSDVKTIVDSTPNNGSFMWKPIPNVATTTAKVRITDVGGAVTDSSDNYFKIDVPVWLEFQNPVEVSDSTVTFSYVTYEKSWDEFSVALSQDHDGLAHIVWHGMVSGLAREIPIRSMTGTSWTGEGGCFFTWGGTTDIRKDRLKLAAAANNTTFVLAQHWTIFFSVDVDHYPNGHSEYNWPCLNIGPRVYLNGEIMADDLYVYMVGDGPLADGPGIYSQRVPTPNWNWVAGTLNTLSYNGEISHVRSWCFHDGMLVLAYYTVGNQIKLLKQTNQTTDTWDDTEVIFNGSGYTGSKHPSICEDGDGRLIATWVGRNSSTNNWEILASMKETPTSTWTTPVVAASYTSEPNDVHVTCSTDAVDLPTGDSEYVVLIGYEINGVINSQISPKDLWAFLPADQVNTGSALTRHPDNLCMKSPYQYDALFAWHFEVTPGELGVGNWDTMFRNGDFKTP
ncbi:MAG TPA: hypothetical protein ENN67_04465 [Firmicutes bacterium]|nr:hypothetical protein [Bacillota bacterium]